MKTDKKHLGTGAGHIVIRFKQYRNRWRIPFKHIEGMWLTLKPEGVGISIRVTLFLVLQRQLECVSSKII